MALSEGEELEYLRLKKRRALASATPAQNRAQKTGTDDTKGYSTPTRFLAGMGGELVNMGRGALQGGLDSLSTFLDPEHAMNGDQPAPSSPLPNLGTTLREGLVDPAQQSLQQGVQATRQVQAGLGTAGKVGAFGAEMLPVLATLSSGGAAGAANATKAVPLIESIPGGAAASALQGYLSPAGPGEKIDRTTSAGTNAAVAGLVPVGVSFFKRFIPGNISGIIHKNLSALLELGENAQNAVFTRAQEIMDHGHAAKVTLTGPEALQQAMEEHGIGGTSRLGTLQRVVEQSPSGEGLMAQTIGKRADQVQQAGEGLLTDTFGMLPPPEETVKATETAATTALKDAVAARTAASEGSFKAAAPQVAPAGSQTANDLAALKAKVDEEIRLKGTQSNVGKKLVAFRQKLDQGVDPETGEQLLGPIQQANRETAINLRRKYNPQDADKTFDAIESGVMTPLNKDLTDILTRHSPEYGQALEAHIGASPDVNALQYGGVGRMAEGGSDVGGRLTTLSDEFLSDTARPSDVFRLAGQLGKIDPTIVAKLVGTRLQNIFAKAMAHLQSGPNPWGGAKFITQVMGNGIQRANLEATIKSLPDGAAKWAAWNKLATVLKATGKRKAAGSETAQNLGVQAEVAGVPAKFSTNPIAWADNVLEAWAAKRNGAELARVFTHPQAALEMQKLATLPATGAKARVLAASVISLLQGSAQPSATTLAPPPEHPDDELAPPPGEDAHSGLLQQVGDALIPSANAATNPALDIPDATWARLVDAYRPELMIGRSPQQLAMLKKDADVAPALANLYFAGKTPFTPAGAAVSPPHRAVAAPAAAPAASQGLGALVPQWVRAISHSESSGNPNAVPRDKKTGKLLSSALGLGQFTRSTWLDLMRRKAPELIKGKTEQQILEMRRNPQVSARMIYEYGEENGAKLRKAGIPDVPITRKITHFLGARDGIRVLKSKQGTPVERVVSAASIAANRRVLEGKKVDDIFYWAKHAMGAVPEPAAGPSGK